MAETDELSGSELRRKYEEALAEVKTLRVDATKFRAAEAIQEKGYSLVKPEDLAGVALDKIDEVAAKIHEDRLSLQKDLARDLFERQGFEGDELEAVVTEYMEGRVPTHTTVETRSAEALQGVRALERLDARPVGYEDTSKLFGVASIEHGLAKNARRKQ